jgi:D-threo-aldose 1-dehydrogenase
MSFDPVAVRPVGKRGLKVSRLGFGTAPFGDAANAAGGAARSAFDAASDAGLRYFDTAPLYGLGLAEHRLGEYLRSVAREEKVISTKVGRLLKARRAQHGGADANDRARPFDFVYDYSYNATMRSLEDSLRRLDSSHVDIVLIHDVNRRWQGDRLEERYREAMEGAYRALDDLRRAGEIGAIGVGVNDWEILLRFAADGDFDCFMLAGRYTLLDHTALDRFMPECQRRGIAVLMAAPYNSGILATGAAPGATFFYTDAPLEIVERTRFIEQVCKHHDVALPAAALQFPLAHPAVASVVTGMRNAEEVAQNIAHCRRPIPSEFWQELKHEGLIAITAPVPGGPQQAVSARQIPNGDQAA